MSKSIRKGGVITPKCRMLVFIVVYVNKWPPTNVNSIAKQ